MRCSDGRSGARPGHHCPHRGSASEYRSYADSDNDFFTEKILMTHEEFEASQMRNIKEALFQSTSGEYEDMLRRMKEKYGERLYRDMTDEELRDLEAKEAAFFAAKKQAKPQPEPEVEPIYTSEFKAWFGDWEDDAENASKVVDDDGYPLVVYHGTPKAGFEAFDRERLGKSSWHSTAQLGFFFSSERVANGFTGLDKFYDPPEAAGIYPVYLNMRNPYEISAEDFRDTYLMPEGVEDWRDGDDPVIQKNVALLVEKLEKDGHDGIIIRAAEDPEISDTWEELASPNFVVFSPEQIKSVFNRGTWDSSDPRILFQPAYHGQSQAEAALERDVPAWEKTVDGMREKPSAPQLMLTQTPLVMHLVGADFKELYAAPHVFDGMFGASSNPKHNIHKNIDAKVLKQIPKALSDPIAVFRDPDNESRMVFMLEVVDASGATVVVPVEFSAQKSRAAINLALSVYAKEKNGKPNVQWFIEEARNAVFINRKKDRDFWKKNQRWIVASGSNSLWDVSNAVGNKVLTEADLVKLREQYPAHYSGAAGTARGGMRKMADGRYVVGLFKKADASTILHETAHFWLEELREAARLETTPEWVHDAWAKLQTAYDFEGFLDGKNAEGVAVWRGVQERFAREFEAYAREGKAPSWELQSAFNKFRNWLTEIYRTVRKLLGAHGVSEDAREVFDVLLATEEEIALSQRRASENSVMDMLEEEVSPELRDRHARNEASILWARRTSTMLTPEQRKDFEDHKELDAEMSRQYANYPPFAEFKKTERYARACASVRDDLRKEPEPPDNEEIEYHVLRRYMRFGPGSWPFETPNGPELLATDADGTQHWGFR